MALDISGATFGYDAAGVKSVLNEIKLEVIDAAVQKMDSSFDQLKDYVDSAWVGKSANIFKENMEKDKNMIKQQLNDSYEAIEKVIGEQLKLIMYEADANLVKARKE